MKEISMYTLIRNLTACLSVSGRETAVSEKISQIMKEHVDEIYRDNLGSLIAVKYADGKNGSQDGKKKIMLCAHMDEIGFMVTFIEDSGYIRLAPIGGVNLTACAYSNVIFENGTRGVLIPEAKKKPSEYRADMFYVDIGASSKKEAEKKVKIGDCFAIEPSLKRLCGKRVCGRPLDDRVGCAVMIDIARKLCDGSVKLDSDVYFVFSVQEEVGCRGAKPAAFGISPDYALVFDVTGTGDCIGDSHMALSVGKGAAVKIKDMSVICNTEVVDKLFTLAQEKGIKHQCEILTYGGTDTSAIQMTGVGCRVGAISIPTRYIHTGVETIDIGDAEACSALAVEFIRGI